MKADVSLPAVFGSHMVLQQGRALPVWGTADPGEQVTVEVGPAKQHATADKRGQWRVLLPSMNASFDTIRFVVRGHNEITLEDVLVGEVWLASGQSNMEWPLSRSDNGAEEVANAALPGLRLFRVVRTEKVPVAPKDVEGAWAVSSPESAADFSAVAYFFGRRLLNTLNVPVGLVGTWWGGTPVEAWTSERGLKSNAEGQRMLMGFGTKTAETREERLAAAAQYEAALQQWDDANRHHDGINEGEAAGYANPGIPEAGWTKTMAPGHWEDSGLDGDGAVWFRKDVAVPATWVGQELHLGLGLLNDCDTIYVNGTKVGQSCRDTPTTHGRPRNVVVPASLVKPGRLLVAVRIFDERGRGGFSSDATGLYLQNASGEKLSLAGRWNMRVEKLLPSMEIDYSVRPKPPVGYPHPSAPHALWDAMVAPLVPYALRGFLWYQGEANAHRAYQYRSLFAAMIKDWRKAWRQGNTPFYYVQLANFVDRGPKEEWAELREAQTMALSLPNTGMAVAIDVGNPNDIHPINKLVVGERLARLALANDYGKPVVSSGPLFKAAKVQGHSIRVSFAFAEGLRSSGGELSGFTIAGADQKFVPATAVIDGDTVVVQSDEVAKPVAVRYGWEGAPVCNLQNGEGLPASPFRSDRWPEITKANH
ncbi:MAG: sialate O-acetylesterase [Deltaproteobacteria bacterium]|nr:sialate O-acetylesterase [Deltaproteobacteria bacterium]